MYNHSYAVTNAAPTQDNIFDGITNYVKENPLVLITVAATVAWLFFSKK